MRRVYWALMMLVLCGGLVLFGCDGNNDAGGGAAAGGSVGVSEGPKMDKVTEAAETQLESLRKQMVLIQARVDQMEQDARKEFGEIQSEFEKQYDVATVKLSEWKKASGQARADMQAAFEAAVEQMKKVYKQAADQFSEEAVGQVKEDAQRMLEGVGL